MEQNIQPNPVVIALKKIWPTFYRGLNAALYFLFSILKSSVKGAFDQFKA